MDYGLMPDHSNVYRWIVKYTRFAAKALNELPVEVGNTWVADETVLKLKAEGNVWFWDIIDEKTRFLLASHLTPSRFSRDAQTLMERAARRANKVPKVVITDKLRSYLDGIDQAFGADTRHVQSGPFVRDRKGHRVCKNAIVKTGLCERKCLRVYIETRLLPNRLHPASS